MGNKHISSGKRASGTWVLSSVNVGFEDQFYFSRVFKKETGISPVSFIKNPKGYF